MPSEAQKYVSLHTVATGAGQIKMRARIKVKDESTVVIKEIPPTTTTDSLIGSIEDASRKGKIKVRSINDYTSEEVEIEVKAPSGDVKAETKTPNDKPKSPAKAAEEDEATKQAALKQWEDRLTSQKEQIDLLSRELNVLEREYQIRAAAMYADAGNRMRNETAWDKEDADYKKKIDEKKKAVDAAKQELDDMEENARRAGVPSSVRE